MGFEPNGRTRDYLFRVLRHEEEAREFTLSILNQAFAAKTLSYQDAADICYRSLQSALGGESYERPLANQWTITAQAIEEYQNMHRRTRRRL